MNVGKAALIAGFAQMLWAFEIIAPRAFGFEASSTNRFGIGFMVFESLALAIFFLVVYWKQDGLRISVRVKFAAFVAAICLGVENILPAYGTIRGVLLSSRNELGWRYHPFLQLRYVLGPAIPTITVALVIIFLIVIYQESPGLARLDEAKIDADGYTAIRVAAALAFAATIVVLGQLVYFVASSPILQMAGFATRFALRLFSVGSLATFFFSLAGAQQRANYELPVGN